jgi:hypothetical protein
MIIRQRARRIASTYWNASYGRMERPKTNRISVIFRLAATSETCAFRVSSAGLFNSCQAEATMGGNRIMVDTARVQNHGKGRMNQPSNKTDKSDTGKRLRRRLSNIFQWDNPESLFLVNRPSPVLI